MKKLFIATIAMLFAAAALQAQPDYAASKKEEAAIKREEKAERKALRKLEGQEPSYQAQEQFARDFDNVSHVEWKRTGYFDEASFIKDGQPLKAFYDHKFELVGTTTVKTFADLPAAGQKTINKRYKDYTVQKVILFDDNEYNQTDMLMFGQQFDDADNYFVELQKDNKSIVLEVDMSGLVSFFTNMK